MSANQEPSKLQQYWQRRVLYNGPMILDLCNQPTRFLLFYYVTYFTVPPFIQWLQHSYHHTMAPLTKDIILSTIIRSLGKCVVYSVQSAYAYLCPSSLKPYIVNPFEWTPYHYQMSCVVMGSMAVFTSYIHSYLYFRNALNERLQWPSVYDHMMNKQFTNCIRDLLQIEAYPLNDNFHIDLTLKLFPIIKHNYFDYPQHNRNVYTNAYELKIVQFTAANVAWYSTKWNKVSIQSKHHRIVGVFLCDYDADEEEEASQRKTRNKEIRDSIVKIKKSRLNDLNTKNKLNWCKNMAMTLQTHFTGDWVVMVGHRARYRSFHSVILQYVGDPMDSNVQKVPLQINNKTDATFIHFGLGPRWYNWSVIVARIQ